MNHSRCLDRMYMLITLIGLSIWIFIKLIEIVEEYVGFSNIFFILFLAAMTIGSLIMLFNFFVKLFKGEYNEQIFNFLGGILVLGIISLIFWGLFTILPNGIIGYLLVGILFFLILASRG
jgi:hypothetical protein